jgi:hypothetical protein
VFGVVHSGMARGLSIVFSHCAHLDSAFWVTLAFAMAHVNGQLKAAGGSDASRSQGLASGATLFVVICFFCAADLRPREHPRDQTGAGSPALASASACRSLRAAAENLPIVSWNNW